MACDDDLDLPTQLLAERMTLYVTKAMCRNLVEEFVQRDRAPVEDIKLYVSRACDLFLGPTDPHRLPIAVPAGADVERAFELAKDRMIEIYDELVELAANPRLWR